MDLIRSRLVTGVPGRRRDGEEEGNDGNEEWMGMAKEMGLERVRAKERE